MSIVLCRNRMIQCFVLCYELGIEMNDRFIGKGIGSCERFPICKMRCVLVCFVTGFSNVGFSDMECVGCLGIFAKGIGNIRSFHQCFVLVLDNAIEKFVSSFWFDGEYYVESEYWSWQSLA